MKDTIVVRVGRTRVTLKRGTTKWSGTHEASGLLVRAWLSEDNPWTAREKWYGEVGGYLCGGRTAQVAVSRALVRRRDQYEAQRQGALGAVERCERALAAAKKNAAPRAAAAAAMLEALR